jgi:hypothetical protein
MLERKAGIGAAGPVADEVALTTCRVVCPSTEAEISGATVAGATTGMSGAGTVRAAENFWSGTAVRVLRAVGARGVGSKV